MGASGHLKTAVVVNTISIELVELFEHGLDVDDNTVSKKVLALWVQDAARKQMERILDSISDDGMASVCSAIKASAQIVLGCKNVDKLALALVAPLRAENDGEA